MTSERSRAASSGLRRCQKYFRLLNPTTLTPRPASSLESPFSRNHQPASPERTTAIVGEGAAAGTSTSGSPAAPAGSAASSRSALRLIVGPDQVAIDEARARKVQPVAVLEARDRNLALDPGRAQELPVVVDVHI